MTEASEHLKKAVLWEPSGDLVHCFLCNWNCKIANGKKGRCFVRKNIDGTLYSLNYDKLCAANPDPIEKKPLFHFQPGTKSFSIAAPGCNFQCVFCQNWQISQMPQLQNDLEGSEYTPQQIVNAALQSGCKSIAYTYTEPTVFMELCEETATLAKQNGLSIVFVSNGFMTTEAIDFARPWLDGINVDLKAFSETYYHDLCKAKLQPVLDTITTIAQQTDIWMEITTLVVPGQNDSDEELKSIAEFIAGLSVDIPWHVSRFYPQYKMTDTKPTNGTSLERAIDIGKEAGLRYIYVGNLPGARAESTYCYSCGALLIERTGYHVVKNVIDDYRCPQCNAEIAGFEL
ncbi:MAG: AmmeMemoRadiSam system radical SAM enzyme [Planctomycetota bacterium]|jgi:pyruvate formate lyase activating enzyme